MRTKLLYLLLGAVAAVALQQLKKPPRRFVSSAPKREPAHSVHRSLRARELLLTRADGTVALTAHVAGDGTPLLTSNPRGARGTLRLSVSPTGFPSLLVGAATEQTFGLGRVDEATAAPWLEFHRQGRVKLRVTLRDEGQSPFEREEER